MIGLVLPKLPVLVHLGVGPGTDPPQERLIGNESIVVLRVAALLDQNVNLLTLELLTKEAECAQVRPTSWCRSPSCRRASSTRRSPQSCRSPWTSWRRCGSGRTLPA